MAPVRAYERIVEQIEEAVVSGRLKPGERLPGERELMTQFGVPRRDSASSQPVAKPVLEQKVEPVKVY